VRYNSAVEADVALSRCAPSGPRSLTPVVRQTRLHTAGSLSRLMSVVSFIETIGPRCRALQPRYTSTVLNEPFFGAADACERDLLQPRKR
jgi:hypothetical protein